MTLQRLLPNKLGMFYHAPLYDRMIAFAKENTPEIPCEPVIRKWLERFYSGDDNIHILVKFNDNGEMISHGVIDIQEMYGVRVILCHQMAHDDIKMTKADMSIAFAEAIEYVDKLRDTYDAVCSMITVAKNSKVYEKKYGYKVLRTVMIKVSSDGDQEREEP